MPDVNFGEIPFTYDEINIAAGLHKPGTQKSYNNETFAYDTFTYSVEPGVA